ncbi:hypothetical protein AAC387_Pa01g4076 [Persea americana]
METLEVSENQRRVSREHVEIVVPRVGNRDARVCKFGRNLGKSFPPSPPSPCASSSFSQKVKSGHCRARWGPPWNKAGFVNPARDLWALWAFITVVRLRNK